MRTPSAPKLPAMKEQSPVARETVALEALRQRERELMSKRKGYRSTMMTGGLGQARTQKAKALGE